MTTPRALCLCLVGSMTLATPIAAARQAPAPAHPSLAGRWTLQPPPASSSGVIPICGAGCNITEIADTMTVSDGMHDNTYRTSGTPTEQIAYAPTLTAHIVTTAAWKGVTLTITVTTQSADLNGGKPFSTVAEVSITNGVLTIRGSRTDRNGSRSEFHGDYTRAAKFPEAGSR